MSTFTFEDQNDVSQLARRCAQTATVAAGIGATFQLLVLSAEPSLVGRFTGELLGGAKFYEYFYPMMFLAGLTFASSGREWRHRGGLCRALGTYLAPAYSATAGVVAGWLGTFLALGVAEIHSRLAVALSLGFLVSAMLLSPTFTLLVARYLADKLSARAFVERWRLIGVHTLGYLLAFGACVGFVHDMYFYLPNAT